MNSENLPLESIFATISGSISSPSLSWIFFKADATMQSPPLNSCVKQNIYISSVKYVRNLSFLKKLVRCLAFYFDLKTLRLFKD